MNRLSAYATTLPEIGKLALAGCGVGSMPLSQDEALLFGKVANALNIAPNKIPGWTKLAGDIVDKNRGTVSSIESSNSDFSSQAKEAYRLWVTPDVRLHQQAMLMKPMELIILIAILWFVLHYFAKDIAKVWHKAIADLKAGFVGGP